MNEHLYTLTFLMDQAYTRTVIFINTGNEMDYMV